MGTRRTGRGYLERGGGRKEMRAPPLPTDPEPFHSCLHAGHCLFSRASWSRWDVRCLGASPCPVDIVTHPLPVSFGAKLFDSPSHAWTSPCLLPYCPAQRLPTQEKFRGLYLWSSQVQREQRRETFASAQRRQELGLRGSLKHLISN